jgi:RNA polymerase sigma-70 factor (ECF subfamily)
MADDDVERLAARARLGEAEALEGALARLRPELVRFVELRLDPSLRRRLEPEDLVQETLLAVHRRLGEWRAPSPAIRCASGAPDRGAGPGAGAPPPRRGGEKRSVQREEAQRSASCADLGSVAERFAGQPDLGLGGRAARGAARAGWRRRSTSLDELDREILTLRQLEGLSNEHAALELGIEPAAASKRFVRALARLRPLLRGFAAHPLE